MNYLDLTDEQVMAEVGNFGPGMVGAYLFERAEYLRTVGMNNTLGPEFRSHEFVPSEAAMADLEARGMVKAVEFPVMAPVPPSDGVESVEWESTESPTVEVVASPVKRGPGRSRKEK